MIPARLFFAFIRWRESKVIAYVSQAATRRERHSGQPLFDTHDDAQYTALSALFGGPANTTYGENTGVLELSRVHDPKVIRFAACYAILLSFIPKMAEVIGSMPSAIIGGVSFMLYGMISAIGVRNVVENHVDFTKSRNLIITFFWNP